MLTNDTGSVTVETAFATATLITICALIVGVMATLAAYISAVNTAGAAARAQAIGVSYAPARGTISVSENNGLVTITAEVPAVFGVMSAKAVYPSEIVESN